MKPTKIKHRIIVSDIAAVGIFFAEKEDYGRGLDILEELTNLVGFEKTPLESYFAQGRCHLELKNYVRAMQCFQLCCQMGFRVWISCYYIAVIQLLQGKASEAIEILFSITKNCENFPAAWYLLGQIFQEELHKPERAIVCFEKYVQFRPYSPLCIQRITKLKAALNPSKELQIYRSPSDNSTFPASS